MIASGFQHRTLDINAKGLSGTRAWRGRNPPWRLDNSSKDPLHWKRIGYRS